MQGRRGRSGEDGTCSPQRKEEDDGEEGGFMSKDAFVSSSPSVARVETSEVRSDAEAAAAASKTRVSNMSGVLRDVHETLEQFKAWLFTGHDFVKTLEKLNGGGTSSSSTDLEPVSERVRKLVSAADASADLVMTTDALRTILFHACVLDGISVYSMPDTPKPEGGGVCQILFLTNTSPNLTCIPWYGYGIAVIIIYLCVYLPL